MSRNSLPVDRIFVSNIVDSNKQYTRSLDLGVERQETASVQPKRQAADLPQLTCSPTAKSLIVTFTSQW